MPADVTFDTAVSFAGTAVFKSGSTLATGTSSTSNVIVPIMNMDAVFAIYDAYNTEGTLLEQEISLGSYTGAVTSAAFSGTVPANSCFQSVEVRDNKVYVKYAPYSTAQDRSPVMVQVTLGSGDTMDIEVSVNYAQPFEVTVNVVSALSATTDGYIASTTDGAFVTSIQPNTDY